MRGYFLLKGRAMFSEIFSGHMPLMNYISYGIQKIMRPETIYELLMYHRMFTLLFSVCAWIMLVARLKWAGLGFIIFYELYNIYLFGDRFLAEGMIIYPLVYMAGLLWQKLHKKKVYAYEYVLIAFFVWFVIFMREPYVPVALFLYGAILWGRDEMSIKLLSIALLLLTSLVFFFSHSVDDFIFQVFTLNKINIAGHLEGSGTSGIRIVKVFFYPFFVFFEGQWNIIRFAFIAFVTSFFILILPLLKARKFGTVLLLFFILGIANLRYTEPGKIFYAAHHVLNWYGLLVLFVFLLLTNAKGYIRKIPIVILTAFFLFTFFSQQNVLWTRVNTIDEIHDGFASYSIAGRVFKLLASDNSTLFVDGGDDLIYFRSGLDSPYQYGWYTSLMPLHKPFREARITMFQNNPPDFYYGNCRTNYFLPDFVKDDYVNLKAKSGERSCLYVRKDTIQNISESKWREAEALEYSL